MAVPMRCPFSNGVVEVPEDQVDAYWTNGWRKVAEEPAPDDKPKRQTRTRKA